MEWSMPDDNNHVLHSIHRPWTPLPSPAAQHGSGCHAGDRETANHSAAAGGGVTAAMYLAISFLHGRARACSTGYIVLGITGIIISLFDISIAGGPTFSKIIYPKAMDSSYGRYLVRRKQFFCSFLSSVHDEKQQFLSLLCCIAVYTITIAWRLCRSIIGVAAVHTPAILWVSIDAILFINILFC